jgi:hypothetical protein
LEREEARCLLAESLAAYRGLSYAELVARVGHDAYLEVQGPSSAEYQIEIQFVWDDKPGGAVRVMAGIDDGSLRGAFRPVCEDFIMMPDGRLAGE